VGGRILIADDDPDDIELLSTDLKAHGYQVSSCLGGQEALAAVKRLKPDLVILDILMPGIAGNEVGRALGADPETKKIPVLYLTGLRELGDIGGGAPAGGILIPKPSGAKDFEALRVVIRKILSGAGA
jgi:CheY-like chemotaxis protein